MGDFNQAKYIQKYQKEKYDRCIFNVPKGQREIIETHWRAKGYRSLNAYINDLIKKDMKNSNERSNQGGGICDMEHATYTQQENNSDN